MSSPFDDPLPRQTLAGQPTGALVSPEPVLLGRRYRILEPIGRGGMGEVYLAADESLDDMRVAIKLLPREISGNVRALEGLKGEAKLMLTLTHENLVRLHSFGWDEERKLGFLVMEYVNSETLEHRVHRLGSLSLRQVSAVLPGIRAGLAHAHEKGVLHRDIKPANVLVTDSGEVKVADFGIASSVHDTLTRLTGRVATGSMPYMSPEQLMGLRLDARADVYSLAVTVYELLAGDPPFHRGDIQTQILGKLPERLAEVPPAVMNALIRGLAKDPEERQASVDELCAALLGETTPIESAPSPSSVRSALDRFAAPFSESDSFAESGSSEVALSSQEWMPVLDAENESRRARRELALWGGLGILGLLPPLWPLLVVTIPFLFGRAYRAMRKHVFHRKSQLERHLVGRDAELIQERWDATAARLDYHGTKIFVALAAVAVAVLLAGLYDNKLRLDRLGQSQGIADLLLVTLKMQSVSWHGQTISVYWAPVIYPVLLFVALGLFVLVGSLYFFAYAWIAMRHEEDELLSCRFLRGDLEGYRRGIEELRTQRLGMRCVLYGLALSQLWIFTFPFVMPIVLGRHRTWEEREGVGEQLSSSPATALLSEDPPSG